MGNWKNSRGIIPAVLLIYGAFAILASLTAYLGFKEYQLKRSYFTSGGTTATITLPTQSPEQIQATEPLQPTKPVAIKTNDPDPIIKCNSKTGTIEVRRSICSSYVDCPDGKGGYIFESQESCTKLWNGYKDQLTKAATNYANAMNESTKLQYQLQLQQYQQATNQIVAGSNVSPSLPPEPVYSPTSFNGFIKDVSPPPTPSPPAAFWY